MNKILMSILLVLMLAFSMLGNVNIAKAEEINIGVKINENNNITVIKEDFLGMSVQIPFKITNNNVLPEDTYNLRVTSFSLPTSGDNSLSVTISPQDQNIMNLEGNVGEYIGMFSVGVINQNTPLGTYTGTLRIIELDAAGDIIDVNEDGNADNFIDKTYAITIAESNPSISFTGLNSNNELVLTGEEDSTTSTQTFTITNNGNRDLDLHIGFPNIEEFKDSEENQIRFLYKIGSATAYTSADFTRGIDLNGIYTDSSLEVSLQAVIPSDIGLDVYNGLLTITSQFPDLVTGLTDNQLSLVVKVEPEICSDGRLANKVPVSGPNEGNGLRIEIDSPDNDDDFNIGEEFDVEVTVKNKADEDLEAVVEVILYDLDNNDKIDSWETDSVSIDKDDESDDFTLTISFPNDDSLDGDGTYILYVKAVDDGNEDEYCNYDSIQINLNRESDDVIINALTMNPTVIAPGDLMSITIGVENIGKDDQTDVYVKLSNPELGLDITSDAFDLKEYSKTSDNDMVKTFTFTVPENAAAKEYYIEAIVYDKKGKQYDNNDLSKVLGKIMIQGEPVAEETTTPEDTTPTIDNTNTGAGAYQPTTGSSVWDNIGSTKTLFVIGDIVLVILAVLFLILIFKKR